VLDEITALARFVINISWLLIEPLIWSALAFALLAVALKGRGALGGQLRDQLDEDSTAGRIGMNATSAANSTSVPPCQGIEPVRLSEGEEARAQGLSMDLPSTSSPLILLIVRRARTRLIAASKPATRPGSGKLWYMRRAVERTSNRFE